MGSKSRSTTIGYRYYMTLQYLLCRGPVNEIVKIRAGDKDIWPNRDGEGNYDTTIYDDRVISIDAPNIFGGDKSEGGIQGSGTLMMGKDNQTYMGWFKSLLGEDVPDFRGFVSLVFDGMICAMNPYPKEWEFRVRRTTAGWDGDTWQAGLATIWLADGQIMAMNPAHIIYECVTNRKWGRGYDRSRIGEASWVATAQTLYNEGFGLCMRWSRQDTLQSFVQEVLDHIGGTLYTDRETGLLQLKLIRDDYNVDSIPLFDRTSGLLSIEESETATLAEAVSEVIVKYTDILANEDREVRAQNLAIIQSNEGTNSQTNTYSGIPIQSLAARVAQRDLKALSSSSNRYTVKLDRRAWRIYPGAVFRVADPDMGIDNLILRAGKTDDGTLTDGKITVEAVLDVFGLGATSFISTEEPAWQPPVSTPLVITDRVIREATYQEVVGRLNPADLAILDVNSTTLAAACARPGAGLLNYTIATRVGTAEYELRGSGAFVPMVYSASAIDYYDTTIGFVNAVDMGSAAINSLMQIGNEILYVTGIALNSDNVSGTLTVLRGCVDTVPATHPINSKMFFVADDAATDSREYVSGESLDVKLLSTTSTATLSVSLAATDTLNMIGRQGRPYAPGAVKVNTTSAFNNPVAGTNFRIEWAHRDRKTQADQIISHWDSSVGPETGVTYNLRFYSSSGTLLRNITGITDNFRDFTSVDATISGSVTVELESVRDGLVSTQIYRFAMSRSI